MKEIGQYLKETRISNGVSVSEACEDLNITKDNLENLEEGNIRAFKDVYALKEMVKEYSKYLGLNADKVIDEFNDFMFEHTSRISLDDLKEARKIVEEQDEKPKVVSPYTYIPKEKFSLKKIKWKKIFLILGIVLIIVLVIFSFSLFGKDEEKVTTELKGKVSDISEFSN